LRALIDAVVETKPLALGGKWRGNALRSYAKGSMQQSLEIVF
jgi:hypothetical protein